MGSERVFILLLCGHDDFRPIHVALCALRRYLCMRLSSSTCRTPSTPALLFAAVRFRPTRARICARSWRGIAFAVRSVDFATRACVARAEIFGASVRAHRVETLTGCRPKLVPQMRVAGPDAHYSTERRRRRRKFSMGERTLILIRRFVLLLDKSHSFSEP